MISYLVSSFAGRTEMEFQNPSAAIESRISMYSTEALVDES